MYIKKILNTIYCIVKYFIKLILLLLNVKNVI